MNYEEFKELWTWALRESGLPIGGVTPIEETLDLRSTDRHCKSFVYAHDRVATFHVSAELGFRWDALQTARTATTEEDLLRTLFRRESQRPRTAHPWLRVDVTLRAATAWGQEVVLPPAPAWQRWARETLGRLETIEPVLPSETIREGRNGLPEVLAWQSEPELQVLCGPAGELKLRGVEVATWQAVELPRRWDDPDRRPDQRPDAQLEAMVRRLRVAMDAWMEALDHLTPR